VVVLSGVLVLAIDAGAWAACGRPGGQVDHGHPGAGALPAHPRGQGHRARLVVLASGGLLIPSPPPRRRGQSRGVQLTVEASGDLLIHSPIFDRALALGGGRHYDFAPFFVRIRPYIRGAGLALCHVETPMTPAPPAGYPIFNTPPELATAIRQTGWRACSTAATHTLDQGQTGVDDTIRALDRAGVAHTGSFSSAAARATPLIMTVNGVRVAFLAYTELTNGLVTPADASRGGNQSPFAADPARVGDPSQSAPTAPLPGLRCATEAATRTSRP